MFNILFKKYMQLRAEFTPPFDDKIYQDFGVDDAKGRKIRYINAAEEKQRLAEAKRIIKTLVLHEVSRDVNRGLHDPLFRPVYSFGSADKGEPYRPFYDEINKYLKEHDPSVLMHQFRMLLSGTHSHDTPDFLPNLVGAWCLAEPTRNHVSIMVTLMLLDLMESKAVLEEQGVNLYTWPQTLVHPSEMVTSDDGKFYRNKKGGCLPMCHDGAVGQSKVPFTNGTSMNRLRKKEGRIIIDWLCRFMQKNHPEYQPEAQRIDEDKEIKFTEDPVFSDVIKNEKKIIDIKKDIAFKSKAQKDTSGDVAKLAVLETQLVALRNLAAKKQFATTLIISAFNQRLSSNNFLDLRVEPAVKVEAVVQIESAAPVVQDSFINKVCYWWMLSSQPKTKGEQDELKIQINQYLNNKI